MGEMFVYMGEMGEMFVYKHAQKMENLKISLTETSRVNNLRILRI